MNEQRTTIVDRVTSKGNRLVVVIDSGDQVSGPTIIGMINGKYDGSARQISTPAGLPPGTVGAIGRIAVTKAEADAIISAFDAARTEWSKSFYGLKAQRDRLSDSLAGCIEQAQHMRTRNFHKHDTGEGMGKNEWDSKAESAAKQLADFDAAHPEIKDRIVREKAEASRRFAETN